MYIIYPWYEVFRDTSLGSHRANVELAKLVIGGGQSVGSCQIGIKGGVV